MLISLLSSIGLGALEKYLGYLKDKRDAATDQMRIEYDLKIAKVQEVIEQKKAQVLALQNDNEYPILRCVKAFFFGSVAFYLGMIFIVSALGIDPNDFQVKKIPDNLDYIPYSVVGYWTLTRILNK